MKAPRSVDGTVSTLLAVIDSLGDGAGGVLLLAATNAPWSIDGAFWQAGRFDRGVFVPPPDTGARQFMLQRLLGAHPTAPGLDLAAIAEATLGYSGADLLALVELALDYAVEDSEARGTLCPVSRVHLFEAMQDVPATTGAWLARARTELKQGRLGAPFDDLAAYLRGAGD